jgi:hypothetical protein
MDDVRLDYCNFCKPATNYSTVACEMQKLTPREETFCIAILAGQKPSRAYRTAYQPKAAKAKTVHEMASD